MVSRYITAVRSKNPKNGEISRRKSSSTKPCKWRRIFNWSTEFNLLN